MTIGELFVREMEDGRYTLDDRDFEKIGLCRTFSLKFDEKFTLVIQTFCKISRLLQEVVIFYRKFCITDVNF